MQKKIFPGVWGISIVVMIIFLYSAFVCAEETENLTELKKQIENLQKRVEQLEAEKKDSEDRSQFNFQQRSGTGRDLFEEINRMQKDMDQMFQNSLRQPGGVQGIFAGPENFDANLDFKETDKGYEIEFDMTGLDKDRVDVQINEHSITIQGEQSRQDEETGPHRYFSAQSFGAFMKTIPLPIDADTTKTKTEKKGDILVIQLPKKNK